MSSHPKGFPLWNGAWGTPPNSMNFFRTPMGCLPLKMKPLGRKMTSLPFHWKMKPPSETWFLEKNPNIKNCYQCSFSFLYLLFGCAIANFGPLSKGKPHSPEVDHCVLSNFQPEFHGEPHNESLLGSPLPRALPMYWLKLPSPTPNFFKS